jgi:Na+/melibiose symporter-like transporter
VSPSICPGRNATLRKYCPTGFLSGASLSQAQGGGLAVTQTLTRRQKCSLGILFAIFYPLERESYTEIAQQLEAQRKTKTAQTDDDI